MNKLLLLIGLTLPIAVFAGDPIPGIDITVNQSPGGIVGTGTTDGSGTVIISGLNAGPCSITLNHKGQVTELGNKPKERIIIPGKSKGAIKPIRLELSRESMTGPQSKKGVANHMGKGGVKKPGGIDSLVRKRPGANAEIADAGNTGEGTKAQDYNSSRSNNSSVVLDPDGAQAVKADCREVVEITPIGDGRLKIQVTCES